MNLLLIDIGNTRIKWASLNEAAFQFGGYVPASQKGVESLQQFSFTETGPDRVIAANVAGTDIANKLSQLIEQNWGIQLELLSTTRQACGVTNAYEQEAQLGIDRWAAMLAAFKQTTGAVCVVSCGTATTIDVIDESGKHLGGLILPGITMMQQVIVNNTVGIKHFDQLASLPDNLTLGQSTETCLAQGTVRAVVATIEHVMNQMDKDNVKINLLLTGGDGDEVQKHLSMKSEYDAHLVLKGLGLLANTTEVESAS
ncbi:MAG: type III pantothenate kinase [Gammaproteobacteria bacterium]|nr:type III pantothenate kinase [Gammaproteobacteria bacterium]